MAFQWNNKRVLITGVCGFIGAYIAKALKEQGAYVTGLDSLPAFRTDYNLGVLSSLDITLDKLHAKEIHGLSPQELRELIDLHDVVFHMAANSSVEGSRKARITAYMNNVDATVHMVDAAVGTRVKAFVYASSNHVYGPHDDSVREDAAFRQFDTYSATKAAADILVRSWGHNYDVPIAVVRNTNCYGPHDPHWEHLIPGSLRSALNGESITLRSKGETLKAYLHVEDVVSAYLAVAIAVAEANPRLVNSVGNVFNVSDLYVHNAQEIAELCRIVTGQHNVGIRILGEANDQSNEHLDSSFIRDALGWAPNWSLEAGLHDTAAWMAKHIGREVPA
jgi:nucleoside-diphosphate-sugar epimerase